MHRRADSFLIGQLPTTFYLGCNLGLVTHLSKHHMTHLPGGSRLTFSCVCVTVCMCSTSIPLTMVTLQNMQAAEYLKSKGIREVKLKIVPRETLLH